MLQGPIDSGLLWLGGADFVQTREYEQQQTLQGQHFPRLLRSSSTRGLITLKLLLWTRIPRQELDERGVRHAPGPIGHGTIARSFVATSLVLCEHMAGQRIIVQQEARIPFQPRDRRNVFVFLGVANENGQWSGSN